MHTACPARPSCPEADRRPPSRSLLAPRSHKTLKTKSILAVAARKNRQL